MSNTSGTSIDAIEAITVVAILILLLVIGVQGCTRNKKICIAEKTIAEIVSVSRHETTVKYTDGTFQRVSTLNGATVGDVKCLAYQ